MLRNLVVTVDYFNIRIRDAIVATPLQFILDQCYAQSNTALCSFITRRSAPQGANSAGSLNAVNSANTNSGGVKTSGIDTTINYRLKGFGGDIGLRGSYTRLISGFNIPLVAQPTRDEFARELGASRDRFTAGFDFNHRAGVGLTMTGTYTGVAYLDDQLTGVAPGNGLYRISPQFYLDGQIRFQVQDRFEFFLGANNLLDNKPPYLADIGASAGQDTDAGTYDALGRRYYAGFRIKI